MITTACKQPRLAVSIGDPNGIGPEITLKAAIAVYRQTGVRSLLVGDKHIIEKTCALLDIKASGRQSFDIHEVEALPRELWQPGKVDAAAGAATVAYTREAVSLALSGGVGAVAAAPHCETAVNASGIPFSGYSGLVADLTHTPRDKTFLLLEAQGLRVLHATLHESVRDAALRITRDLVESACDAARQAAMLFGIERPKLCVLGINPHAGEGGLFGDEDERSTKPAVQALQKRGLDVIGPIGADLALSERTCDVYVAMLHDQGHIAVKMLSPKGATAWVAGIPIRFASVGHGAAFDIAGTGAADASAMIATLLLLAKKLR